MDKALTVKQPWADLIMAGAKDVENRSWPVPSTLPQWWVCERCGERHPPPPGLLARWIPDGPFPFRLGIHAGQEIDKSASPETWAVYPVDWGMGRPLPEVYALGALLGFVTVTGCHHADECQRVRVDPQHRGSRYMERCSRWAEPDVYHWTLANPEPLDVPFPMKGRLGLWHLDHQPAT
jgi:hypothetical protein